MSTLDGETAADVIVCLYLSSFLAASVGMLCPTPPAPMHPRGREYRKSGLGFSSLFSSPSTLSTVCSLSLISPALRLPHFCPLFLAPRERWQSILGSPKCDSLPSEALAPHVLATSVFLIASRELEFLCVCSVYVCACAHTQPVYTLKNNLG